MLLIKTKSNSDTKFFRFFYGKSWLFYRKSMAAIPNLTKLIRSLPLSFLSSSLPSALFARSKSDFVLFWTSQSSFTAVFDPVCFFANFKIQIFLKTHSVLSNKPSPIPDCLTGCLVLSGVFLLRCNFQFRLLNQAFLFP